MRALSSLLLATAVSCAPTPKMTVPAPAVTSLETPAPAPAEPPVAPVPVPAAEVLAADTPKATVAGNPFIAPAGWTFEVRGPATILTPPDTTASHVALVDVEAKNADQAVTLAWAAYNPATRYPLKLSSRGADTEGWTGVQDYEYIVSPNERRVVGASARSANGMWLVVIIDVEHAIGEKRGAQFGTIFSKLRPRGHDQESFKGKPAHALDKDRLAALMKFVETSMAQLGVPGVGLGIVQNGKVVFAGGLGVRELGKPAKVDADTKFMIASNTKALTTLMLAKLVEEKKLTWDTSVASLYPSFKLGDAETTSKVLVKHLVCACTGMPRQDFEMIFEYGKQTPVSTVTQLAGMQPTSKFGELFQYSNPLASAGGYIGGRVAFPKLELGKAYDQAMQTRVFRPLGMTATTFDSAKVKGNVAVPHSATIDGAPTLTVAKLNQSVIPSRPAGGAWSTVRDMLKYVQMELSGGKLPGGKQYIAQDLLFARRTPQVAVGPDSTYGMGLAVSTRYGVEVIRHGGDLFGFHSDMIWIPEHNVGAVILTNGDPGGMIRSVFARKLLEVLFDGRPQADAEMAAAAKGYADGLAAQRKLITVPAAADAAGKLATSYNSTGLGEITVRKDGPATVFDFGEFKTEMASQVNPDGTVSFVTIAPGIAGIELVVGAAAGKKTLVLRDAQHEYVFTEK